jgi:hypothetical protein
MENRGILSGDFLAPKGGVATKSVKNDSYEAFTRWCALLYDMLFFWIFFGRFQTTIPLPSLSHLAIVMVRLVSASTTFVQVCKYKFHSTAYGPYF